MQLDIDGPALVAGTEVRQRIEREIARRLGPFAGRIRAVTVRLGGQAPSQPPRTLCGIAVSLEPCDECAPARVLARAEDDDTYRAVDCAAVRAAGAVDDELARRDRRQAGRARALAFAESGSVARV